MWLVRVDFERFPHFKEKIGRIVSQAIPFAVRKGLVIELSPRSFLKPGTERNNGGTFRPVPPTKIRNCAWIKAHKTKTVITKFLLAS